MDAQVKKKNHSSSSSSSSPIGVLFDELLIEVFIRLPCCKTAITCKFVSKHWLSLLSNPKFVVDFRNHKKTQSNQQQQLPWTFLSTMRLNRRTKTTTTTTSVNLNNKKSTNYFVNGNYKFPTHKVFSSPKFTFNFLPFPFKVAATFKDLILLCIKNTTTTASSSSSSSCSNDYCICNPVTKQWVVLPATPTPLDDHENSWASLICEDPYYNASLCRCDFRFRVVVIHPIPKVPKFIKKYPVHLFNLLVFCSETFQWKSVNLSVALHRLTEVNLLSLMGKSFFGLVCNGLVCVRYNAYFGIFNPFDVTCATSNGTTLEAMVLPLYGGDGQVFVCGKRLVTLSRNHFTRSHKEDLIQISMRNQFLELNGVNWMMYFIGRCRLDNGGLLPLSAASRGIIGMHPSNIQLFYLLTAEYDVVLCDMGLQSLKVLGILHPDHFESSARLELQYWPTPLPQMGDHD